MSTATIPSPVVSDVAVERHQSLRIETLGGLRVFRSGEPVHHAEWGSRKARDLLKILVSRRGRAVTREALMDVLWPGESPEEVGNRLNVLVSTVRAVLDPERTGESVIRADAEALGIDLDRVVVDVEEFLADAHVGLRLLHRRCDDEAQVFLARAEARYTGAFLEDTVYEDFSWALREEARATYREVAAKLANRARATGDPDAAIRYLLRSLEQDPYDEPACLDVVELLSQTGRHGDAQRTYATYRARMAELDIDPSPFPGLCSAPEGHGRRSPEPGDLTEGQACRALVLPRPPPPAPPEGRANR